MSSSSSQKREYIRMNILTISNYFPNHPGGIEFVAQNLVQQWRAEHIVRWMACDMKTHPYDCTLDDVPLDSFNFTEESLGFPYPIPSGKSILKIVREVKACDLVHLHDCLYFANFIAFLASRWYRKPVLITQHAGLASYSQSYKRILQHFAYYTIGKLVLENAEQVVFISSRIKNWFESWTHLKREAFFLPNGVDHNLFFPPQHKERVRHRAQLGIHSSQKILLFIGRFMQNKGIRLVREIAQARPNYHWLIIGSGEIDPNVWKLPNVYVMPPQPQVLLRKYYIMADLFVLPSVGEGFPLSVQEALSCGLPAAVSGETAASLPDAPLISLDISSVPKLLKTIDGILDKPGFLNLISRQSSEYAKRWDWEFVSNQYIEHFTKTIHEFRAS